MAQDPNSAGGDAGGDAVASVEKANAIRTKLVAQPHCAQANYFLNVYFDTIGDDKEGVFALLEQFAESGEEKSSIGAIQFMTIVQKFEREELKDSKDEPLKFKKIEEFPATDATAISNKFRASGVTKGGEVPIFDALLAIFGFTLVDTMNLPATPCLARQRAAELKVEQIKNDFEKIFQDQIDAINAKKKLAEFAKNLEIKQVNERKEAQRWQLKQDLKAPNKAVEDAKTALAAETKEGTAATNWLKDVCKKKHKKFIPFKLDD